VRRCGRRSGTCFSEISEKTGSIDTGEALTASSI
jgi:hypothetical protein